ncbi:MAG: hypothetical protein QN187_05705 [Armatimonadota bacterium]|nr:hypothetical protein [Armatimonadota bacterium]MDR7518587.1 hypothetical protein [Armatimonadota bacterium]MDR7549707.1 hypothetical protein [Armatimonadota bacterium]
MPPSYATVIAGLFALAGFLPLAWPVLRRPGVWLCLVAGAAVSPIAREAAQMAWDWAGPYVGQVTTPGGAAAYLLIVAAVSELVKVTAPLLAIIARPADALVGLAYGAAAGAGFAFVSAQPVLASALQLVGSPYITAVSSTAAVMGWLFPILAHVCTTAYLARAGARGGFAVAFLFVWALQFVLGFAQQHLPVWAGIPAGLLVTMVASLWLFGFLWAARVRAGRAW